MIESVWGTRKLRSEYATTIQYHLDCGEDLTIQYHCGAASPGTNCPDQGKMRTCADQLTPIKSIALSARVFAIKIFNGAGHIL